MLALLVDGGDVRTRADPDFTNYKLVGNHVWLDTNTYLDERMLFMARAEDDVALGDRAARLRDKMRRRWVKLGPLYVGKLDRHAHLVDGRVVRARYDVDFALGGHDLVYDYIPSGEVWIESCLAPAEQGFTLLHERVERAAMAQGASYEKAHAQATREELAARRAHL